MVQETATITGQEEPQKPTEAQLAGTAAKSFLLENLGEAFSALPEILEDGTYVYNVGHSSPQRRNGVIVAKVEVDGRSSDYFSRIHELVVLNHEGIFRIRYAQEDASHPILPVSAREIAIEEYPAYKERALAAIWEAPHFPQPPLNP